MRGKGVFTTLAAGLVAFALGMPSALAVHVPVDPGGSRDPLTVAKAMFADPSQVSAADEASDGATEVSHASLASWPQGLAGFPTNGPDYGLISSGNTDGANDPNAEENKTTDNLGGSGALDGLNEANQGQDLGGIEINFNAPQVASPCLQVDVKFLSDEFDEFIGSAFNDFAMGRLDNTSPPTVSTGPSGFPEVSAPGNFLLDPSGSPITVNGAYLVGDYDGSTTYDNATPKLTAQTPVTAGPHTLNFWVGDAGDSIYDTTLFVDNVRVIDQNPCPVTTIGPSVFKKIKTKVKGNTAIIQGQILPPVPGQKVFLTFFANGSPLKKVAKGKDAMNANGVYKKKFKVPGDSTKCMVKAVYKGDAFHLGSKAKKKFKC
ncbi:MAG: choice-of-anchor L domain-containing protein [Actinomycetota bacterium]